MRYDAQTSKQADFNSHIIQCLCSDYSIYFGFPFFESTAITVYLKCLLFTDTDAHLVFF